MKFILTIFLLASAFHLCISLNLPSFIPEHDFPYKNFLLRDFISQPFTFYANSDGIQYLLIAKNGYEGFQQSFFPLYPWIISFLQPILAKNYLFSGIVASWLFFLLGIGYFYKLSQVLLKDAGKAKWSVLLLVAFPTAYYYQAIYTESLLLFLSSAALYYLYTKKFLLAALFAAFASLTKIQAAFLVLPFAIMIGELNGFTLKSIWQALRTLYPKLLLVVSPLYGLGGYMIYLFIKHNDPLYFYHAQSAFGAERSVDKIILLPQVFYRYIKIFMTYPMNFVYWISVLEFVVCILFVGVIGYELYRLVRQKKKNMQHVSLQLYSMVVLILPTLTGTLTSLPRYALISFGFFFALANSKHAIVKGALITLFSILHVVLFIAFLKGYFVS